MVTIGTISNHLSVAWRGNSLLISVTEDGRTARYVLWPEEVEEFMEAMERCVDISGQRSLNGRTKTTT